MAVAISNHAFTTKSGSGILIQLKNKVSVFNGSSSSEFIALWDTGASVTCISSDVVTRLGLVATGKKTIKTPSGSSTVNTYLISVTLPDNMNIPDVEVCDSKIGDQGFDVLIGMDIITKGDFAVSNFNGTTVFTFRIPSVSLTDYVTQAKVKGMVGTHGKGKRKRK